MTDPELKEIAEGIVASRIFTDRHVRTPEDLRMVFPVLGLMDEEQVKATAEKLGANGMIFEAMSKASPMGVNGYPMFFSCGVLTSEEADTVWDYHDKIKAAIEAVG